MRFGRCSARAGGRLPFSLSSLAWLGLTASDAVMVVTTAVLRSSVLHFMICDVKRHDTFPHQRGARLALESAYGLNTVPEIALRSLTSRSGRNRQHQLANAT